MVRVEANRINAYDRFEYRIIMHGRSPASSEDMEEAVALLASLGVKDPERMIEHARTWGELEISLSEEENAV